MVREERTGHFMISTHRDFPTLSYLCAPIIPPTPVYTRKALCIRVAVVDALDHSILKYTQGLASTECQERVSPPYPTTP